MDLRKKFGNLSFGQGQLTPESRSQKAEARTGVVNLAAFFNVKKKTKWDERKLPCPKGEVRDQKTKECRKRKGN